MGKVKKYIFMLIVMFAITLFFANTSKVNADNIEEKQIEYSKEISSQMLEEIKTGKFKVMTLPRGKLQANPDQEDISKYYYNQLKNDISRNTYNTLDIEISNELQINLSNLQYYVEDTSKDGVVEFFEENLLQYVMDGYEAYVMDNAKNYWWTSDVSLGNIHYTVANNNTVTFKKIGISSTMEEWTNNEAFNTKLEEISNSIKGKTTYEIVKNINYYICNNVAYEIIENTDIEQTAYGALILNKAVCEGHAQLFNLLCRKKGVISINVYGYTSEPNEENTATAHAWNYVYEPSREKWYAVDTTWNNTYGENLYIMLGSETSINEKKFGQNHIAGFKQFGIQSYTPATPVLASDKYVDDISIDGDYIKNIQPNMTLENFSKEFTSDIEFSVMEGENTVTGEQIIKTGQKFITANKTYILVVLGDVNGDGKANINDIMQINKHRLKKIELLNECNKAGDVNKDNALDITDIMLINKYRLKKIEEF